MAVSQNTNPPADGAVNPSDALGGRHPSTLEKLEWFDDAHLPAHLAPVARACGELARQMVRVCPDHPQLAIGLQHLIDAKDCFVRARTRG